MRVVSDAIKFMNDVDMHPLFVFDIQRDSDGSQDLIITPRKLIHRVIEIAEDGQEIRPANPRPEFHLFPKQECTEADMLTVCSDWDMKLVDENKCFWILAPAKMEAGA